jgi:nicotinamide-nucleotide amidase
VDDVTRDAAALATDRDLVPNDACLESIEAIFARWGRKVHDNNRRQAYLPAGSTPIFNPVGTAPGFVVEVERKGLQPALLICLPGVPREMMHLMQESVEPFLAQRLGPDRVVLKSRTLRVVGMGESIVDTRIADLMRRSNPTVGLAAHLGQVDVRITARASTEDRALAMLDDVVADVRARLGDFVYAEGDVALEAVVGVRLREAGYGLAIVETSTGGELVRRFEAVSGLETLVQHSQVVTALAELAPGGPVELVSAEAAEWAARQIIAGRDSDGTVLGLALCGTLDPAAGPYGAYRGETFVGLAIGDRVASTRVDTGGTDELARRWIANGALNWIRMWLAGKAG